RRPPLPTVFPYTTLFRSRLGGDVVAGAFTGQRTGAGEVDDGAGSALGDHQPGGFASTEEGALEVDAHHPVPVLHRGIEEAVHRADRKSTRLNSSHVKSRM